MSEIEYVRVGIVLFSLGLAAWLYSKKTDGAGWFIFFAILTACGGK